MPSVEHLMVENGRFIDNALDKMKPVFTAKRQYIHENLRVPPPMHPPETRHS